MHVLLLAVVLVLGMGRPLSRLEAEALKLRQLRTDEVFDPC